MYPAQTPRFLFYSHDSFGLGHLRRTLAIATECLQQTPGASGLIATGSPVATRFPLPPGLDVLKLPHITKDEQGRYVSGGLSLGTQAVVDLRAELLRAAVESYRPDVLFVDHKPIGLCGELVQALEAAQRWKIPTMLGLRDIIDTPESVAREWEDARVRRALADGYDRVCVYGDRNVFDAQREYPLPPELGPRIEYVGYVTHPRKSLGFRALPHRHPHVVVTVGGGQDGDQRLHAYLDGIEQTQPAWTSTLVLGPLFEKRAGRALRQRASALAGVEVHRFCSDLPARLEEANAIVAMAGYNTTVEVLQSRTPAVLLPRMFPREEQRMRGQRLAALGLTETLETWDGSGLMRATDRALGRGRLTLRLPDMNGRQRAAQAARELIGLPSNSDSRQEVRQA